MEKFLKGYGIFVIILMVFVTVLTIAIGGFAVAAVKSDKNSSDNIETDPDASVGEQVVGAIAGGFAKGLGMTIILVLGVIALIIGIIEAIYVAFFIKNYVQATKKGKITKVMDVFSVVVFVLVFVAGIAVAASGKESIGAGIGIMVYAALIEGYAIPSLKYMKKRQEEKLYGAEGEPQ